MDEEIDDEDDDYGWALFAVILVFFSVGVVDEWIGTEWLGFLIGILLVLWAGMAIYKGGIFGSSEGYTRKTTPVRYYVTLFFLLQIGIEFILASFGTSIFEITH